MIATRFERSTAIAVASALGRMPGLQATSSSAVNRAGASAPIARKRARILQVREIGEVDRVADRMLQRAIGDGVPRAFGLPSIARRHDDCYSA